MRGLRDRAKENTIEREREKEKGKAEITEKGRQIGEEGSGSKRLNESCLLLVQIVVSTEKISIPHSLLRPIASERVAFHVIVARKAGSIPSHTTRSTRLAPNYEVFSSRWISEASPFTSTGG